MLLSTLKIIKSRQKCLYCSHFPLKLRCFSVGLNSFKKIHIISFSPLPTVHIFLFLFATHTQLLAHLCDFIFYSIFIDLIIWEVLSFSFWFNFYIFFIHSLLALGPLFCLASFDKTWFLAFFG